MDIARTRRQREVLDYIRRYMENHGHEPSYQMVARHLGVTSKSGIGKHIKALEKQGLLHRRRVEGSFRLVIGKGYQSDASGVRVNWVDVKGRNGEELESWEMDPITVPEFMLGNYNPGDLLAYRVPDEAMEPRGIHEGDIVLIEQRDYARDGTPMVVTIDNKITTLRLYYRAGAGIRFEAANESFDTVTASADEVEIHGVYRALLRPA